MTNPQTCQAEHPDTAQATEPGRYFAHCGPPKGAICNNAVPGAIGVHVGPNANDEQIGMAFCHALVRHRGKSVMVWRLVFGKEHIPGTWVVVDREFIDWDAIQERLAIQEEG